MFSEARLLFIHAIRVSLLIAAIIGIVFFGIQPDPDIYFAGSLQQVKLLEKTKGPRIILFGGSNVAFGLDAELIQKELGVPAINDGLHIGLGIVPLRELEQFIHEGDVIIISLEYNMFFSKFHEGVPAFLSDWI